MARQFLSSVVDQELYIQTSAFLKSIGTAEVVSERYMMLVLVLFHLLHLLLSLETADQDHKL